MFVLRGVWGLCPTGSVGFVSHRDNSPCVPEGPNDRSQAIYCLEHVQPKIRPVGHGLILTHGWLVVLIVARLSDLITPSLRDGSLFERIPGNKLPGYDHLVRIYGTKGHDVPSGQSHPTGPGWVPSLSKKRSGDTDERSQLRRGT